MWTVNFQMFKLDFEKAEEFSSVAQLCPPLCDPMNRSTPGLAVHHQLPESTQTHVHRVGDDIQPSHPLSSPSPRAPNPSQHQVFSSESTLRMRWPKYWSFSFSISPSNEYPGLISFRKGRGTRDQIANISGSSKKQESSRKTSASALLTMPKLLTVRITTKCGKFLKRSEYQITWPDSWETCMQVRKQHLELDMEQQTGSISGKEYIKAEYCHPAC